MSNTLIFIIIAVLFAIIVFIIVNDNINRDNNKNNYKQTEVDNNYLITTAYNNSNNLKNYLPEETSVPEMELPGYENELIYVADDIKEGSYANQFKEIDYSKMKMSNNQIGFNPEPRCSSGALPLVDVHMNYLLTQK